MRITTKGQVTIPMDIRERFGFLPNTEIQFIEEDGRVFLKKVTPRFVQESPFEYVRGTCDTGMSTDEIMSLTRGEEGES